MAISHKIKCPRCENYIAKYDRRKKLEEQLIATYGAYLSQEPKQAPKVICPCGMVVILLEGSVN